MRIVARYSPAKYVRNCMIEKPNGAYVLAADFDAVCAELGQVIDLSPAEVNLYDGGAYLDACKVEEILEAAGLKVKP